MNQYIMIFIGDDEISDIGMDLKLTAGVTDKNRIWIHICRMFPANFRNAHQK